MRKAAIISVVLAAMLTIGVAAASAVRSAATATTVNVQLKEFNIIPKPTKTKAGKVTFVVKNVGKIEHEFVVIRTNLAPGKLPVSGNEASEKGAVGEVPDLAPGESGKVTFKNLKPGKYVLICNIAGHYKAGQYIRFQVTA